MDLLPALRAATRERLQPVVRQLVADVVADDRGVLPAGESHVDEAAEFVMDRVGGMAPHLGTGMAGLTLAFDAYCSGQAGGLRYHQQDIVSRRRHFEAWRKLPGPLQSWTTFYEKMGTFAYWSVVEEAEHGVSGSAAREQAS